MPLLSNPRSRDTRPAPPPPPTPTPEPPPERAYLSYPESELYPITEDLAGIKHDVEWHRAQNVRGSAVISTDRGWLAKIHLVLVDILEELRK